MLKSFIRRAGVAALSVGFLLAVLTACSLFPQPPVASFVVDYNVTDDIMVADLNASGSADPNEDVIISYMWAIDDDVSFIDPLASSKTVPTPILRVRFPDEGNYTITLLVVDATGTPSAPVSQTITLPRIVVNPTE